MAIQSESSIRRVRPIRARNEHFGVHGRRHGNVLTDVGVQWSVGHSIAVSRSHFLGFLLLVATPCAAASVDLCAAASAASNVKLALAISDGRSTFQQGEIIPLSLKFTTTAKSRYWADVRNYDRSGRLGIEVYCLEPQAPDPLESYFRVGAFVGGGLGGTRQLSETPFEADAELNEWRSPAAGHYRLYVVSHRVYRPPDPGEKTQWGRIDVSVRSNVVEFDVQPAMPAWQAEQIQAALRGLISSSADAALHAARVLRFLNTEDSTKALAEHFWTGNEQMPIVWDLKLGLFGSPYPKLAIDTLRQGIGDPGHAITDDFLWTLVRLEINNDPAWKPPPMDSANQEQIRAFWDAYQAHDAELTNEAIKLAIAELPAKTPSARALTLNGMIEARMNDAGLAHQLRPALIAAWKDLPAGVRDTLIQYRWQLIGGPEMLPILQQIVDEPPPPARTMAAMTRDAALKHIYELDPGLARSLIVRDLENKDAQPGLQLIRLLSPEQIAKITAPAVERVAHNNARELDYALLEAYGEAGSLESIKPAFEAHLGEWACELQTYMLRYFLRVAPAYGVKQVDASIHARKSTGCYRQLLQDLANALPTAQQVAMKALNDPNTEVAQDAALALGRWGTPEAEPALWTRMEEFYRAWMNKADTLRPTPDYRDPASRALALQQNLVSAICAATNWICSPEKLVRLEALALTEPQKTGIEGWIKLAKQKPYQIQEFWFPEERPTFSVLQYEALTEEQLPNKIAQFPRGARFTYSQTAVPTVAAREKTLIERMKFISGQHGIQLEVTAPQ